MVLRTEARVPDGRPAPPVPAMLILVLVLGAVGCSERGRAEPRAESGAADRAPAAMLILQALPATEPFPSELGSRLQAAYAALGPDYVPRTEHLLDDGRPLYTNRLILEDSPYLIQHAHNPVNWFAWGDEAFEKAQREDKPIFLSIGYSTCHWCHVMERESFDDVEVARQLNEGFVAIKVDRERRPDVDEVYMTAVQLMTGSGGWPMSSLLTPDGKTFFGGTYFPRDTFLTLLSRARQAWQDQRPEVLASADRIAEAVERYTTAAGEARAVDEELIVAAVQGSLSRHDAELGGFSPAPKFPSEPELLFLLDRVVRTGDAETLAAVETTLQHMARGGIYDQVGGGFHRYSTDARWLVPHFEKMLYNQAHLARAYTEAFAVTGQTLYARVARQTLDYVLRDLTSPDGAFYSATDADSEGEEGLFFVWTPEQLRAALPAEDAELAIAAFGVTEAGNFEGRNILHVPAPLAEVAASRGETVDALLGRIDGIRERLYTVREERVHPLRDDKVVTAWNAMMITSLARAAVVFGEPSYGSAGAQAAEFLWTHSRRPDGSMWRAHLNGSSSVTATLEDYAYLADALVELHEATGDRRWLDRAREMADVMVARLWDCAAAGFFMGETDHDGRLPARPKSPNDGAIPSGNSVAVRALARLAARTGEDAYRRHANEALAAFAGRIEEYPAAFPYMLLGASELLQGSAGPVEHGARGVLRASASVEPGAGARRLTLRLDLADGWHVNAHRTLQDNLIPTALELAADAGDVALRDVRYPAAETVTLGFQSAPLAVYQGSVTITGTLTAPAGAPPLRVPLSLTVQACDDQLCLAPEQLSLEVPLR